MPIVHILVILIVAGVLLWLVNTYVPMAPPVKSIVNILVVLTLCVWLLSVFGILDYTLPRRVR